MPIFGRKKRPPTGKGVIPVERIKELTAKGIPETEIIGMLRSEGFSPEEIDKGLTEALKTRVEAKKEVKVEERPTVEERPKEPERPAFAPIFIKLDKYRSILNSINELKRAMITIRNILGFLTEMEKLRGDALKMIRESVAKVDKRLTALDAEFLRPTGFREEYPREEMYRVEAEPGALGGLIADLRSRVERLRADLESM
jgi:hypothetical protein